MSLTYCNSEGRTGDETFGCLNPDGHTGQHRSSVTHGRCPNCGGIEDHADTCPTPDLMEDTSQPLQEIVWGDDGLARLEPYEYDPDRVPTYLLSTRRPKATTHHKLTIGARLAAGGGLYPCCSCGWTGERTFDAVLAAGEWDHHYAKETGDEGVGEPPLPFTTDHLIAHLQREAQLVLDRGLVTRGQRLVIHDLLLRAAEEIDRLRLEP